MKYITSRFGQHSFYIFPFISLLPAKKEFRKAEEDVHLEVEEAFPKILKKENIPDGNQEEASACPDGNQEEA